MTKINRINVEFHCSDDHTQDDIERAREAAQNVLDAAGITDYAAFYREVVAAIDECREIFVVWREAEYAAQRAGTLGWRAGHEAIVEIYV